MPIEPAPTTPTITDAQRRGVAGSHQPRDQGEEGAEGEGNKRPPCRGDSGRELAWNDSELLASVNFESYLGIRHQ